jgi:hypothetical protein
VTTVLDAGPACSADSGNIPPLIPSESARAGVRLHVRDERFGVEAVWLVRDPDWQVLLGKGAALVIRKARV